MFQEESKDSNQAGKWGISRLSKLLIDEGGQGKSHSFSYDRSREWILTRIVG